MMLEGKCFIEDSQKAAFTTLDYAWEGGCGVGWGCFI